MNLEREKFCFFWENFYNANNLKNCMSNQITCPNCGHHFSLSEIQKHELEEMRAKIQKETEEETKKKAFAWANAEIEKQRKEAENEAKKIREEMEEKNKKQILELENLRKRDEEARKKEEQFLRQQTEFENLQKNLEIEKERAKLEERKRLEDEFSKQAQEKLALEMEKMNLENEKRLRAKDEQIEQMKRSIEDAKRKSEQGSMQIQGELQENALKELLAMNFPFDTISDVEKGIRGADLVQDVRNEFGQNVGKIAWESKNTKNWTEAWVEKLKEDRLRAGAGIAVLVSNVLPEGVKSFGLYRDIWVTNYESLLPLASILRVQMIEMTKVQNSLKGKDEKMEVIYNYLISPEFKAKIENIIEAFSTMQDELDKEKRAMERLWSAREKQLRRVIDNTARLYGDMQGLIGSQLPKVEYLELGDGEEIF